MCLVFDDRETLLRPLGPLLLAFNQFYSKRFNQNSISCNASRILDWTFLYYMVNFGLDAQIRLGRCDWNEMEKVWKKN